MLGSRHIRLQSFRCSQSNQREVSICRCCLQKKSCPTHKQEGLKWNVWKLDRNLGGRYVFGSCHLHCEKHKQQGEIQSSLVCSDSKHGTVVGEACLVKANIIDMDVFTKLKRRQATACAWKLPRSYFKYSNPAASIYVSESKIGVLFTISQNCTTNHILMAEITNKTELNGQAGSSSGSSWPCQQHLRHCPWLSRPTCKEDGKLHIVSSSTDALYGKGWLHAWIVGQATLGETLCSALWLSTSWCC